MSLFPAYSEVAPAALPEPSVNWLENQSFNIDVSASKVEPEKNAENTPTPSSPTLKKRKKPKKDHKHSKKAKAREKTPPKPVLDDAPFEIDTKRTPEYLSVATISRPAAPKYRVQYYLTNTNRKSGKNKKIRRYYHQTRNLADKEETPEEKITATSLAKLATSKPDENFTGFEQEEELARQTAVYNKAVADDPKSVQKWLEYAAFQDSIHQFEKTYRKGSVAKALRVLGERKLSILDKALTFNPNCEAILRERLRIAVATYPADELQAQLKILVDKDPGCIILWQGYIESVQCSMAHCTAPSVLRHYTTCLAILHKVRRSAKLDRASLERNILTMLHQAGLFLRQTGLFEQLWTLLRLYLELNLSPADPQKFNLPAALNERQLVELEEVVLASQLPLHELWLRTEKLRESCHFLPLTATGQESEDPQRVVFAEDVTELIHPIASPGNVFKLVATILTLLKVPLLPCRHSTMQELGLDYVPWALDSIEFLLPLFFNQLPVDMEHSNIVIDARLAVGPQYLNALPGQEQYLDFILATMRNCIDCLKGDDKTAITIWYLRFQRLLVTIEKQNRFKLPKNYIKKIKTNVKNLLKLDENRNNIFYYIEYARIEQENGNHDACVAIIEKTATSEMTSAARTHLYRSLIEVHLVRNKQKAMNAILEYIIGKNTGTIDEAAVIFSTSDLDESLPEGIAITGHFMPDFTVDFIAIKAYFLSLRDGPVKSGVYLDAMMDKLVALPWHREVLVELKTAILSNSSGVEMHKIVEAGVKEHPNNVFLLGVLARLQEPWWRLKALLLGTQRAFGALFLVLALQRKAGEGEGWRNRMLAVFRRATAAEVCTRRCGLVWRLYLQFVNAHFGAGMCRDVYYSAVEECPWLKALYIDAAVYIPAELAQIQDLIIEKQLRLHVTPEELEVLRS